MIYWIAILAAVGCALCNGVAAILQKMSADKEKKATSLHAGLFFKLLQDWPYLLGTALDGFAWVLTLVAVHSLPLFVVQPIIAFSVIVTALVERFVFHKKLTKNSIVAIGFIITGLLLLAATAAPETARSVQGLARWGIIVAPVLIAGIGAILVRIQQNYAAAAMAALSGLGFGGTAIVGRMLDFSPPYWKTLVSPLFISLLAYGLVAILLFTISLQRQKASVVNAVMIAFETLAPALVGITLLGDHPRSGMWSILLLGAIIALTGTFLFIRSPTNEPFALVNSVKKRR